MTFFAAHVARRGEAREILSFHRTVALQREIQSTHLLLTIEGMTINRGFVLTIGNRAFVHIVFEKVRATLNCRVDLRVERLRTRQQRFLT